VGGVFQSQLWPDQCSFSRVLVVLMIQHCVMLCAMCQGEQRVLCALRNTFSLSHFHGQMEFLVCSILTPPPIEGTGYCNRAISFFLSLFVCLFIYLLLCQQHYEKTVGPICMKFPGKVLSDHGTTWFNFGSVRVNGSAGRRASCLLSPAIAQRR